ncbi:M14 family zinc carboxypeptidase [Streptomyces sp. NPDC051940]|uniref:M14 family zinc carboxypeptidase n=1 Tax=Streptomyces sp. NPDC051940 TaxID=3155675 RepID=UPI00344AEB10
MIDQEESTATRRTGRPGADTDRYPVVDDLVRAARELADRHPRWCELRTVGRSRGGDPLWLLSAGSGPAEVLVVAGPHANEPVGGAAVLRLARRIREDRRLRARARWHLLLCVDPDGARLSEAWARRPGLLRDQFRHYYRPAEDAQPEWLPADGGPPLPETAALTALLDELRPVAQFSLHGNDLGAAWVQLTHDVPEAARLLARPAARLTLPLAGPGHDTHRMPHPAPGLFLMRATDGFNGHVPRSVWTYPLRHGTVSAVVEAPVWTVPGMDDTRPAADPPGVVAEVVRLQRAQSRQVAELVERARPFCSGPVFSGAAWSTGVLEPSAAWWERYAAPGLRTAAGELMLRMTGRRLPLRSAALLARALRETGTAGSEGLRDAAERLADGWADAYEREFRPRWIPVERQARLQEEFVVGLVETLTS